VPDGLAVAEGAAIHYAVLEPCLAVTVPVAASRVMKAGPSARSNFGIAKIRRKRQSQRQQGCHSVSAKLCCS